MMTDDPHQVFIQRAYGFKAQLEQADPGDACLTLKVWVESMWGPEIAYLGARQTYVPATASPITRRAYLNEVLNQLALGNNETYPVILDTMALVKVS